MSHGSHTHHPGGRQAAAAHPGSGHRNVQAANHPRHAVKQPRIAASDYALIHGGRLVRLGPIAFWICTGSLVIMAGWTLMTATYFAFQDDVLTRLIARQAEMQFAYEDRIADMRAQVDRVTSRQLLDQEQIEQKLDQIARKQATLESRSTTLSTFADPTVTGSIRPSVREGSGNAKPAPLGDGAAIPSNDRGARLEPRGLSAIVARFTGRTPSGGLTGTLARLQESIERVEARQTMSLTTIEDGFNSRAKRMRGVLSELGLDPGKPLPAEASGTGGPFVPVRPLPDNAAFEKRLQRISIARAHVERLNRTMQTVPVRPPLSGELDQSSGYGVRVDPFFRRPAMHTGLDFRGDSGDPVRATAAGTVSHAGWQGGYGKLVEVDHGNGTATRYGHLSEIDVRIGQSIKIGQVVGKIGSTGRSTGPHLHYETRVDGDPVDPQKFLRAGARLGMN
jgi:murein DD-endopeptidase MepM/ murein hydrolase activator NlpD